MDKTMIKKRLQNQKCPYCGAVKKDLIHGNIEHDGNKIIQVIDCIACEKHFTEVYSFCRVILTDYPGEDFRIEFNN